MRNFTLLLLTLVGLTPMIQAKENLEGTPFYDWSHYKEAPTGYGTKKIGSETLQSYHMDGMLALNGTTVSQNLSVNGTLTAENALFHDLRINGDAIFNNSKVTDGASINGTIKAKGSIFEGELTINSEEAAFIHCQIESIQVRPFNSEFNSDSSSGKQLVVLLDGTKVTGSITFDSGKGEVILSSDSKILGKVIGGVTLNR